MRAAARPGKALPYRVAENFRGLLRLREARRRNVAIESGGSDGAGARVIDAIEQLADDAERGGNHAAGIARVHALAQYGDAERAVHESAQRGRGPQLIVIAAPRIQRDHELHVAQARRERIQIGRQIVAAAFLAGLDDSHAAWSGEPAAVERN